MTHVKKTIAVLPGDGIGVEIVAQAVQLLEVVGELWGQEFEFTYGKVGGCAIDADGTPLPDCTLELCRKSDAILLGAVGGPKWDQNPGHLRPEAGLLALRKEVGLYANLRPIEVHPSLIDASTVKQEVLLGVDLLIVRELTGGLYFGTPRERRMGRTGVEVVDTLIYTEQEIERIVRLGFQIAMQRRRHLTSVDKANVLESSRLWRETVERVKTDFPDVRVTHMLVDNAAMQLIKQPRQFDVIVTENLFGDILSDEAAMLTGSIGLLPSASLGHGQVGLYEPIHGSAPDIAGTNVANPLATFLSVAMMLEHSLGLKEAGEAVRVAVNRTISSGARTADMRGGTVSLGTVEMGQTVRNTLREVRLRGTKDAI